MCNILNKFVRFMPIVLPSSLCKIYIFMCNVDGTKKFIKSALKSVQKRLFRLFQLWLFLPFR